MMSSIIAKAKKILNNTLVKGALFLCISAFICKIIGVIYRIPLTNIIGAEGIGIYQLIFPIYSFLLILSSNGVPVAISKIVAKKVAEQDYKYIYYLKNVCFIIFGAIGLFFTLLLIALCNPISTLQGNFRASLGYVCIAPSVLIVCFICVYRGMFQGLNNMKPTGISQIIEQLFKFGFGILLPLIFTYKGISYQVAMATLAVTISEIVALIYLIIKAKTNKTYKDIFKTRHQDKLRSYFVPIAKEVTKNVVPIMLSSSVVPISVLIESFIIVNVLSTYMDATIATEIYGVYSGVVAVLINAPIVLASSIGIALVPNVSSKQNNQEQNRQKAFDDAILFASIITIPSALVFSLFSYPVVSVLFPALSSNLLVLSSQLLLCSASNVITLALSYILIYYIQSCNVLYKPVFCVAFMTTIRLIICSLCLIRWGIVVYALAGAFICLMQLLQLILIKKQIK